MSNTTFVDNTISGWFSLPPTNILPLSQGLINERYSSIVPYQQGSKYSLDSALKCHMFECEGREEAEAVPLSLPTVVYL